MEDQQITSQILEAEGVIRELAGHLQRAVDMADAALEAKKSYEVSQAGFESATSQISAGRQAISEVATAVQKDFALGARNLQSAGAALTTYSERSNRILETAGVSLKAFAERTNQTFEGLQKEVATLASQARDLRDIVIAGNKDIAAKHLQGRAETSQELTRQFARLNALRDQVVGVTSRLDGVENSFQMSLAALESVIKRELNRVEQASLNESQQLRSRINYVLWVAVVITLLTSSLVIARFLLH